MLLAAMVFEPAATRVSTAGGVPNVGVVGLAANPPLVAPAAGSDVSTGVAPGALELTYFAAQRCL